MSQASRHRYEFQPSIPLCPMAPGTNLLVSGSDSAAARELALRLVRSRPTNNEAQLLVAADASGRELMERFEEICTVIDRARFGIVDCTGEEADDPRFGGYGEAITGPGELRRIAADVSILYETLRESEVDGVRIGLFSLSALLAHAPVREVSRFLHMLTGRVIATEDLGVYFVDTADESEAVVDGFEHFCDGHVRVRSPDDGRYELRVDGLDEQPADWTPFAMRSD